MKKIILVLFISMFTLTGCIQKKEYVVSVDQVRPSFLQADALKTTIDVQPNLSSYTFQGDFKDAVNYSLVNNLNEEAKEMLRNNYFVVTNNDSGYEYFETYEDNLYTYTPNFVTVDSLLHTYHLFYAYLQKNTEGHYLRDRLDTFSQIMYQNSLKQVEILKGSEWENAANRNVDYYAVALTLLGETPTLSQNAGNELNLIAGGELSPSTLFTSDERPYYQDYSQFTPRGYYTESESLEQYFKAMMWFGQMNFCVAQEDLTRSAILNVLATKDDALSNWEELYMITAFFAGESDDNGYYEYSQILKQAYGDEITEETLIDNKKGYNSFIEYTKNLDKPQINSMQVDDYEDRDETTIGYRVMGQRFSLDAAIMQRLIYRDLPENSEGERRYMPDALDVAAGLGSDRAYEILQEVSDVNAYPAYKTNLDAVRSVVENEGDTIFNSCISQSWLGSLKSLLEVKGEGYPQFMRNSAWQDKDLNTFLGNYTELKHDTVLYAKQVMSELGADDGLGFVPPDDRGYVEPEPQIFEKLELLIRATTDGLQSRGLISEEDVSYMKTLEDLTSQLKVIALKELNNELPTEEEFELIKFYGGQLEHLWLQTVKQGNHYSYRADDYPAALITDIATNGNTFEILNVATGRADDIYVVVYFDGHPRICRGTTFSFYEFTSPQGTRLTDEEWRAQLNNGDYPERPSWISSFFSKDASASHFEQLVFGGTKKIIQVNTDGVNVYFNPSMNEEVVGEVYNGTNYSYRESVQAEGYTWYCLNDHQWVPSGPDDSWVTINENWHF